MFIALSIIVKTKILLRKNRKPTLKELHVENNHYLNLLSGKVLTVPPTSLVDSARISFTILEFVDKFVK